MSTPPNTSYETIGMSAWTLVLGSDELTRQVSASSPDVATVNQRLAAGESPRDILGWTSQRLAIGAVRSVEWIPARAIVQVRRHWLRDPWRLQCDDTAQGERTFQALVARIPATAPPQRRRISPQDLPMEPQLGVGVLFGFLGFLTLLLGALDGVGDAPIMGPARGFRPLAELGDNIGIVPVLAIGAVGLAAGIGALEWWRRNRPEKIVVAARRG